ncbi:MAG: helix-turn-helix domain-containing protein [Treponema sp.]|jgi:transcriptional regulator with XRE-family HTH domain|nr:helix-turn-helix domain-containing protein [Treponema sp.]
MDISSLNIWERLVKLAKTQKKSLKGAAKATGVSEGAISGWKKSFPTVDNLAYLADYYGVSLDYLVFDERATHSNVSSEEFGLITQYRSISYDNKRIVRVILDSMLPVVTSKKGKVAEIEDHELKKTAVK